MFKLILKQQASILSTIDHEKLSITLNAKPLSGTLPIVFLGTDPTWGTDPLNERDGLRVIGTHNDGFAGLAYNRAITVKIIFF